MKGKRIRLVGALAGALAFIVGTGLQAEDLLHYASRPGSKITIDGTSTIHDWTVETQIIGGFMKIEPSFKEASSLKEVESLVSAEKNPVVNIIVPVRSLNSGKKRMDEVMQEAMDMAKEPRITYKLLEIVLKDGKTDDGKPLFDTKGAITVSGVTVTNSMEVALERLENNQLKWTGSTQLKMTDFGIEPPAPKIAFGLISTGDDVTLNFEWVAALKDN